MTNHTRHLIWQCGSRHPSRQFTAKTGTFFEDSPLGLDKWLVAMWQVVNCKNGASSYEVHRAIGVTHTTAWFMDHRIRYALRVGRFEKLPGEVEVDESFIGGEARNMHLERRVRKITGADGKDKAMVQGFAEHGENVRAVVVTNGKKHELQKNIREHVQAGSAIFTDEMKSYEGFSNDYRHDVINHAVVYVHGNVHANTMETFWALLKRGLHGAYVSVEPFHPAGYIDEQSFRYKHPSRDGCGAVRRRGSRHHGRAHHVQGTDREKRRGYSIMKTLSQPLKERQGRGIGKRPRRKSII